MIITFRLNYINYPPPLCFFFFFVCISHFRYLYHRQIKCYTPSTLSRHALPKIPSVLTNLRNLGGMMRFDYHKCIMTRSIRTTPRGAQDKQLLALTRCELPWTPADYKTRQHKQSDQYCTRTLRSRTYNL